MAVKKKNAEKSSVHKRSPSTQAGNPPDSRKDRTEMQEITALFEKIHFQKRMIGGVDEMDVWRQLREIQKEYENLLTIQEERSKALIKERDVEIARLKRRLAEVRTARGESVG